MQNNVTQVPNVLFDVHLKHLKTAELKVLLVVTRQTIGWKDPKTVSGRKTIDWISGNQLEEKTGCSRRAITSAVEALVRMRLLEVLDDRGKILNTASERQGKPRLYYRMNPVENHVFVSPACAVFAQDLRKNCRELVQNMRITK